MTLVLSFHNHCQPPQSATSFIFKRAPPALHHRGPERNIGMPGRNWEKEKQASEENAARKALLLLMANQGDQELDRSCTWGQIAWMCKLFPNCLGGYCSCFLWKSRRFLLILETLTVRTSCIVYSYETRT
jgi:hypothetical protein